MNRVSQNGAPAGSRFSRREFISLGVGALFVSALPISKLARHHELFRRTVPVMGTLAEIAVVHRDRSTAQAAIDDAISALRWTDEHLSRFRVESEIGAANLRAGMEPVPVTEDTAGVVRTAIRWARATDGAFDPSLGMASELWNVGARTAPPSSESVRRYAERRLFESIELSSRRGRPMLGIATPDAALDLGGIGKGYGVDRAVAALRCHGIEHALVNAGGDLYALGESPDGNPWTVGLRSPKRPSEIDRTLQISNRAVATSGDYMQYFEHGGRRYHHLLDPRTAEPVLRNGTSVTVVADLCIDADAGATAAFALHSDGETAIRRISPGSSMVVIG